MSQQKKPPALGKNGFKYRERHGVIVLCATEAEQARVFARLTKMGYRLKVVSV